MGIPSIWGTDPRSNDYFVTMLESGTGMGGGARKTMDGWPTASLKSSNVTLPNIEVEEQLYPISYTESCLETTSLEEGGRADATIVNRVRHGAAGVLSGWAGGLSRVEVVDKKDGSVTSLPSKITNQILAPHQALHFAVAGGGGYGDPLNRRPEDVRLDVLDGYVSVRSSLDRYGVVLDPKTLEVNKEETTHLRQERRGHD